MKPKAVPINGNVVIQSNVPYNGNISPTVKVQNSSANSVNAIFIITTVTFNFSITPQFSNELPPSKLRGIKFVQHAEQICFRSKDRGIKP